jgi:hypothetical protein
MYEQVNHLSSLPALALAAGLGFLIYGTTYLGFGARGVERETYLSMAASALRNKAQLLY